MNIALFYMRNRAIEGLLVMQPLFSASFPVPAKSPVNSASITLSTPQARQYPPDRLSIRFGQTDAVSVDALKLTEAYKYLQRSFEGYNQFLAIADQAGRTAASEASRRLAAGDPVLRAAGQAAASKLPEGGPITIEVTELREGEIPADILARLRDPDSIHKIDIGLTGAAAAVTEELALSVHKKLMNALIDSDLKETVKKALLEPLADAFSLQELKALVAFASSDQYKQALSDIQEQLPAYIRQLPSEELLKPDLQEFVTAIYLPVLEECAAKQGLDKRNAKRIWETLAAYSEDKVKPFVEKLMADNSPLPK